MTDSNFAAYLAGVIDSDGSISIAIRHRVRPNPTYSAMVQLTWSKTEKTFETMNKIKEIYGGSVYLNVNDTRNRFKNGKDTYKYCVANRKAKLLLEDILPFLHLKTDQCLNALELIDTTEVGKYGFKRNKPIELVEKHYNIYLNNKSLNTKNSGDRKKYE